jgi:hypothetical protein
MSKQISGQSIRYEPFSLGLMGQFHPTSLERYTRAKSAVSKMDILDEERGEPVAPSTTETLQRTLGQGDRDVVPSAGIMEAPLISGLASDTSGGAERALEQSENRDIIMSNTMRSDENTPMI